MGIRNNMLFVLRHDDHGIYELLNEEMYSLLRDDVSTDELIPASKCIYYNELHSYCLVGDRHGEIVEGYIHELAVDIVVAGHNFGCGSAREHAAITLKDAGIKAVYAKSFNSTFRANSINIGLHVSDQFDEIIEFSTQKSLKHESNSKFTDIEQQIISQGNLLNVTLENKTAIRSTNSYKPLNIVEKILDSHCDTDITNTNLGGELVIKPDFRFTYEVFAPLIRQLLKENNTNSQDVLNPESIIFFEDHFVADKNKQIDHLVDTQRLFSDELGSKLYKYGEKDSGICHTIMLENHTMPGQIITGTDSHTPTSGALNSLPIPIGATMMAKAFVDNIILVKRPEVIRININGELKSGVMSKDIILKLMLDDIVVKKDTIGKIIEYGGSTLNNMVVSELAVLTNMTAELGAISGVVEPTDSMKKYLQEQRVGIDERDLNFVYPDPNARYFKTVNLDVIDLSPLVSEPDSPLNVVDVSRLGRVGVDKAFIGSCTGGNYNDIYQASKILLGKRINENVNLFIYPSSASVIKQLKEKGVYKDLLDSGAQIYASSCGPCIGNGEGRVEEGEIIVSSSNRNFKGRMGSGKSYLASPITVARSALAGYIC